MAAGSRYRFLELRLLSLVQREIADQPLDKIPARRAFCTSLKGRDVALLVTEEIGELLLAKVSLHPALLKKARKGGHVVSAELVHRKL